MDQKLLYRIALTQIPGVGGVTARRLIAHCGGVEAVFKERAAALQKIPGVGEHLARAVRSHSFFDSSEQELRFIERNGIRPLFYLDGDYPARLKECEDGPLLLYVKGTTDLNHARVVAVIGTRSMTSYGKAKCEELVREMKGLGVLVVSGLAYGVDACAHETALQHGLPTAAVLGHGLDRIYPYLHQNLARKMLREGGALVTDFISGTKPDRENFPKRNRIIAGLCDAVVVIEAAVTGGALITANIANTYNRDVFALPGRVDDPYSQGCNKLIRINKAHLLERVDNLQYIMNWEPGNSNRNALQTSLFVSLTPEEKTVAAFLREHTDAGIDQIVSGVPFNLSKTSSLLLGLEFKGVVKPLPGKHFRLQAQVDCSG